MRCFLVRAQTGSVDLVNSLRVIINDAANIDVCSTLRRACHFLSVQLWRSGRKSDAFGNCAPGRAHSAWRSQRRADYTGLGQLSRIQLPFKRQFFARRRGNVPECAAREFSTGP